MSSSPFEGGIRIPPPEERGVTPEVWARQKAAADAAKATAATRADARSEGEVTGPRESIQDGDSSHHVKMMDAIPIEDIRKTADARQRDGIRKLMDRISEIFRR